MPKLTNMNAEQLFDPAIAKYIDGPELWRDKEKAKAIKDQFNSCFKRINEKYGIKTEPSDYTFNRLIQIKDTLHGKWLEYYLYEIAKELRLEEPDLFDEVYLSVEAYPNGEPENKCFEIIRLY